MKEFRSSSVTTLSEVTNIVVSGRRIRLSTPLLTRKREENIVLPIRMNMVRGI